MTRRLFLATAALAFSTSIASATDLGPLLDGMLEGCAFGEGLSLVLQDLRDAAPAGRAVPAPAEFASAVGTPFEEQDGEFTFWRLPLTGTWKGHDVVRVDRIGIPDTGVYAVTVIFSQGQGAVEPTFGPLTARSQEILNQDEFSLDFGHSVGVSEVDGNASVYCDLST